MYHKGRQKPQNASGAVGFGAGGADGSRSIHVVYISSLGIAVQARCLFERALE